MLLKPALIRGRFIFPETLFMSLGEEKGVLSSAYSEQ